MWVSTPLDAPLQVSADGAAELATAFEHGTKALLAFAQDAEAVLWPEHSTSGSPMPSSRSTTVSPPAIRSSEALCLRRPWTVPPGPF
jgi:hypothetical protein